MPTLSFLKIISVQLCKTPFIQKLPAYSTFIKPTRHVNMLPLLQNTSSLKYPYGFQRSIMFDDNEDTPELAPPKERGKIVAKGKKGGGGDVVAAAKSNPKKNAPRNKAPKRPEKKSENKAQNKGNPTSQTSPSSPNPNPSMCCHPRQRCCPRNCCCPRPRRCMNCCRPCNNRQKKKSEGNKDNNPS